MIKLRDTSILLLKETFCLQSFQKSDLAFYTMPANKGQKEENMAPNSLFKNPGRIPRGFRVCLQKDKAESTHDLQVPNENLCSQLLVWVEGAQMTESMLAGHREHTDTTAWSGRLCFSIQIRKKKKIKPTKQIWQLTHMKPWLGALKPEWCPVGLWVSEGL